MADIANYNEIREKEQLIDEIAHKVWDVVGNEDPDKWMKPLNSLSEKELKFLSGKLDERSKEDAEKWAKDFLLGQEAVLSPEEVEAIISATDIDFTNCIDPKAEILIDSGSAYFTLNLPKDEMSKLIQRTTLEKDTNMDAEKLLELQNGDNSYVKATAQISHTKIINIEQSDRSVNDNRIKIQMYSPALGMHRSEADIINPFVWDKIYDCAEKALAEQGKPSLDNVLFESRIGKETAPLSFENTSLKITGSHIGNGVSPKGEDEKSIASLRLSDKDAETVMNRTSESVGNDLQAIAFTATIYHSLNVVKLEANMPNGSAVTIPLSNAEQRELFGKVDDAVKAHDKKLEASKAERG